MNTMLIAGFGSAHGRAAEPVTEARDRERDGGDDELPPARILHGHDERFGHPGAAIERNEGADYPSARDA